MTFKELGLSDLYIERLTAKGINEPTEIQVELFKPITAGESVLGLAKTGTGKTLSYLGPLVERYSSAESDQGKNIYNGSVSGALVWVLVPTRELASQVKDTYEILTHAQSQVAVVVGGESEDRQIDALDQARFVVATPGRLLDLLQRKRLSTRDVEVVVMDEADRLLDMGFIDDIRAILRFLEKKPQLVFVSATLHLGVEEVAFEMGIEPLRFGNAEEMPTVEGLDHGVSFVGDTEKFHALSHFIFERKEQRGIVFSNYRERAHELASRLRGLGCKADALSAQLNQAQRSRIVEDYRAERLKVLVASDLAARGLDFFDIEYVVNFDLPEDPATYVHRVGRTARAGKNGKALSFIGFEDSFRLEKLERFLGKKLQVEEFDVSKLSGPLPRFAPRAERQESDGNSTDQSSGRRHERGPDRPDRRPRSSERSSSPRGREAHSQRPVTKDSHPSRSATTFEAAASRASGVASSKPKGLWSRIAGTLARMLGLSKEVTKAPQKKPGSNATDRASSNSGDGRRRSRHNRGSGHSGRPSENDSRGKSAQGTGSRHRGTRPHRNRRGPRPQGAGPSNNSNKK